MCVCVCDYVTGWLDCGTSRRIWSTHLLDEVVSSLLSSFFPVSFPDGGSIPLSVARWCLSTSAVSAESLPVPHIKDHSRASHKLWVVVNMCYRSKSDVGIELSVVWYSRMVLNIVVILHGGGNVCGISAVRFLWQRTAVKTFAAHYLPTWFQQNEKMNISILLAKIFHPCAKTSRSFGVEVR